MDPAQDNKKTTAAAPTTQSSSRQIARLASVVKTEANMTEVFFDLFRAAVIWIGQL
jgi:hypothetical protein